MADQPAVPKWKYVLAAVGVLYLVGAALWAAFAVMNAAGKQGPSELALHPDRQDTILARQRAAAMQADLGLSEEQTIELAAIFEGFHRARKDILRSGGGDRGTLMMARLQGFQDLQQEVQAVLSPAQYEAFQDKLYERTGGFLQAMRKMRQQGLEPGTLTPEQRRERLMEIARPTAATDASQPQAQP